MKSTILNLVYLNCSRTTPSLYTSSDTEAAFLFEAAIVALAVFLLVAFFVGDGHIVKLTKSCFTVDSLPFLKKKEMGSTIYLCIICF